MALNNDLIQQFKKITRFDLQHYLLGVEYLTINHYGLIVEYYSGRSQRVPSVSFKLLDSLIDESNKLDYIIDLNSSRFPTTDWWDLLEMLEDIKIKLKTILNTPKWSRASVTLSKAAESPEVQTQLLQNQTIERMAGGSLGYADEHQDWYDIAIRNDLAEEDYTPSGGAKLNVSASGGLSFSIVSVVDVIDSETMKGKDVLKKITWEDDDLKVLSGDEAFIQTITILAELIKSDNPEFVFQGLDKTVAAGQNINSISYPILVRQITETFGRDDTIESFSITSIEKKQDGIFVELEITSKSEEIFNISTTF